MNGEVYSPEHSMLGLYWKGPDYHTRVPQGAWVHPTRESLDYALRSPPVGQKQSGQRP